MLEGVLARVRRAATGGGRAAADQEDMRALHASLGDGSRCTLLMFHSRGCRLCRSVRGAAGRALRAREGRAGGAPRASGREGGAGARVDAIEVDAELRTWRPEATQLGVTRVPCFVLLGRDGRAVCRTSDEAARSRESILAALELLLREVP